MCRYSMPATATMLADTLVITPLQPAPHLQTPQRPLTHPMQTHAHADSNLQHAHSENVSSMQTHTHVDHTSAHANGQGVPAVADAYVQTHDRKTQTHTSTRRQTNEMTSNRGRVKIAKK